MLPKVVGSFQKLIFDQVFCFSSWAEFLFLVHPSCQSLFPTSLNVSSNGVHTKVSGSPLRHGPRSLAHAEAAATHRVHQQWSGDIIPIRWHHPKLCATVRSSCGFVTLSAKHSERRSDVIMRECNKTWLKASTVLKVTSLIIAIKDLLNPYWSAFIVHACHSTRPDQIKWFCRILSLASIVFIRLTLPIVLIRAATVSFRYLSTVLLFCSFYPSLVLLCHKPSVITLVGV